MKRNFADWLSAYVEYANHTEAPKMMHYFSGVWAVAAVLRRKVWFDQIFFRWYPSFYVIFVAPPGIVAKSTTADVAAELVREVPGIKFGPDNVTWESLVKTFAGACESYEYDGEWHPMSAINLVSSEFGNLIDFHNKAMVNLFITLWDGRKRFEKETKMSGNDMVEAPWINLVACTTPHWIADNMSAMTVGGGFTSRCIFIYADKKEKYIAYLDEHTPKDLVEARQKLIQDLEYMSLNLAGPFTLSPEAKAWGRDWYQCLWEAQADAANEDWKNGYIARKQTHLHKLALVISAAQRDTRIITLEDLGLAKIMLEQTEQQAEQVFSKIGLSQAAAQTMRLMEYLAKRKIATYEEAYLIIHFQFPDAKDFEGVIQGLIRTGRITMEQHGRDIRLNWIGGKI